MVKKENPLKDHTLWVFSETTIYQISLVLTAIFLVLSGYIRRNYNPDLVDPILLRYILATGMLIIAIGSFRFTIIKAHLPVIVYFLAFFLSAYLFYLSYDNQFEAYYWVSALVILGVSGMLFPGIREFLFYAGGIIIWFVVLEWILYPEVSTPWLFPCLIPASLILQGLVINYRYSVNQKIAVLASFPENSPMPIIEINENDEIVYANLVANNEFSSLSVSGKTHPLVREFRQIIQKDQNDHSGSPLQTTLHLNDKIYEITYFPVEKSSNYRFYITKTSVKDNLIISEADKRLRELKEVEEQLKERNHQMDLFLYKATHDLKGPLTSVVGILNIALQDCLQPEIKQYIELALISTDRLDNAILDLIHVTRLNKAQIKPEPIDCHRIVGEILQSLEHIPGRRQIDFQTDISMRLEFNSDRNSLLSILQNLITNAMKYRRDGDHSHVVNISIQPEKNGIRILVRDNGEGIRPEIQEKVFNMFYRGNKKSKGTGLGLYIVNQSIQKLKGEISIHSVVDEGTTFSVWLPNLPKGETVEV
ncbi:MAG: GHKL domain-containing protein [Bacteroidetes bacterium]|nr:GHKL domain-containing protein [Bacteroidota bacterium]